LGSPRSVGKDAGRLEENKGREHIFDAFTFCFLLGYCGETMGHPGGENAPRGDFG